jgi:hypothetical protein
VPITDAELAPLRRRRAAMSHHRRASLLLVSSLAIAIAACSGGAASSPPSADPSAAPSASPAGEGTVGHPTGASDVILRYDEGGGFVMPSWAASMAPHFTLYGDGTVVFRDPAVEAPPPQGSVFVMNPMQIAKLSEEQIQELLVFALGEGGLAAARPEYQNQMISDASTAVFTIDTGDIQKQVSIYALGLEDPSGADGPARAAFKRLADRLVGLGSGGAVSAAEYVPEGYRVTLLDAAGMVAPDVRAWPWEDVTIADFQPSLDPNGPQFPHLTMTAAQLDQLDITGYEGGFQNLVISGPDGGPTYTLSARPILPGEPE